MNGTVNGATNGCRSLKRYRATWDYNPSHGDELELTRGDIVLVSEEFGDGWMRGLRLGDLEMAQLGFVGTIVSSVDSRENNPEFQKIGFFPGNFVAIDDSPIYKLQDIKLPGSVYENDPKFADYDSSKRSKIALEIFTSEKVYLSKLKLLDEKFVVPLSHNSVLSHEDYSSVFSNIQPLLSLSENLLVQLRSRMEAWDERSTRIGDIFVHTGDHLKLFVSYARQHPLGNQILTKISAQEKFKNWLSSTEVEIQRTLNSLMLEPIQRIPRYELLLKDLLKNTSKDHPDYSTLGEALSLVQKVATDCNENIRRIENELKLISITRQFPNDDVDIVSARKFQHRPRDSKKSVFKKKSPQRPGSAANVENSSMSFQSFFASEHQRVFVKQGGIQDFSDSSERYLFLCSDVLLIAQPVSRSRKTFRLKEKVMLVHAWITDTPLMGNAKMPEAGFILGTPRRMYHFAAATVEEKNSWFQELHSRILTQKRLFRQLLSHLSVPDEGFLCLKAKAKVKYLGMFEDELSFNSGDEILVVGFKDGTGRWRPGLYAQEPFDPSSEWYFGIMKEKFGWFPMNCVLDNKQLEPAAEELQPASMSIVLQLKQRMMELTGRTIPPLTEEERTAKVFLGEGNFKTLRIPLRCTVGDVVRKYFKVKPDSNLMWSLIEQSTDETVCRMLDPNEDPSQVVDFWGKSKDHMRFLLKQTLISPVGDSDA